MIVGARTLRSCHLSRKLIRPLPVVGAALGRCLGGWPVAKVASLAAAPNEPKSLTPRDSSSRRSRVAGRGGEEGMGVREGEMISEDRLEASCCCSFGETVKSGEFGTEGRSRRGEKYDPFARA